MVHELQVIADSFVSLDEQLKEDRCRARAIKRAKLNCL